MMLPFYAADAQNKAAELASTVITAVTPLQIASACAAVESFLHNHTLDQQRWFFSITFPTLVSKIFGFEDSSPPPSETMKRHVTNGWIDVASSQNEVGLAGKIFSLLSPNGLLLSSIMESDHLSLVKYVFPSERLPEWCHYMLQSTHNCRILFELYPIFKSRIKEDSVEGCSYQVQLGILDYYLFWFAYYPVYRGNIKGSEPLKVHRSKRLSFEHWSCSIPGLSSSKCVADKKREGNLYMCLLYVYLQAFIPIRDLNVHEHYCGSLLHYTPTCDGSIPERAEIFLDIIILFWLIDNDFSPLSKDLCKSLGVILPFKSIPREILPTPGTGDLISVFVKFLNLRLRETIEGSSQVESVGSLGNRSLDSFDITSNKCFLSKYLVGSWNFNIQRQLYRYILRTFLFLPVETSIKNAYQAFSVWIDYLEPWSSSFGLADIYETIGLPTKSSSTAVNLASSSGYSSCWQQYILENYMFYSSLVVHFIGFTHRFLHTDIELTLTMVAKLLHVLTTSTKLRDLLKNVEAVFHAKGNAPFISFHKSISKCIPTIRQRLHDWEDGLCESDADGSFLHVKWNNDLRLFADGEDGGQRLLQLLVVRVESELNSGSGGNLSQSIESLKAHISLLFGGRLTKTFETDKVMDEEQLRCEVFRPRTRSFGNQVGGYKGDWMKRPVLSDEIGWLASFLVRLSCWLNEKLGLNQMEELRQGCKGWLYMQMPPVSVDVTGLAAVKVVLVSVFSCIACLVEAGLEIMRKHGMRVNLRVLASKRIVGMLLLIAGVSVLRKMVGVLSR